MTIIAPDGDDAARGLPPVPRRAADDGPDRACPRATRPGDHRVAARPRDAGPGLPRRGDRRPRPIRSCACSCARAHVTPTSSPQVLNAMKTRHRRDHADPVGGRAHRHRLRLDHRQDDGRAQGASTRRSAARRSTSSTLNNADATDMAQKLLEIFGVGGRHASPRRDAGEPPAGAGPARAAGGGGGARRRRRARPRRRRRSSPTAHQLAHRHRLGARLPAHPRAGAAARPAACAEGETGQIHVYPLANADAEDARRHAERPHHRPGAAAATGRRRAAGRRPPAAIAPTRTAAGQSPGAGAFEGDVRSPHDKPTNSLVIVSSAKDFLSLRELIKQARPCRAARSSSRRPSSRSPSTRRASSASAYHGGAHRST